MILTNEIDERILIIGQSKYLTLLLGNWTNFVGQIISNIHIYIMLFNGLYVT